MRKVIIAPLSVWLVFVFVGLSPGAAKYPVKPIEYIIGLEAGSDGDVIVRPVIDKLSHLLGQPIMTDYKPGAGCSIGYRLIHSAKPDGYTIGYEGSTILINKLQGISPYDYHDFTHLGAVATYFPIIIARTKGPRVFKTIQEVIAFGKAHPGELSMSTGSIGQAWWVAAMAFMEATGLKINTIPVAGGSGASTTALVAGGHMDLGVVALGSAKSMVEGGMVTFLATLGEQRAAAPYDKIPTLKELNYDVSWVSTNFLMAPPKLPNSIKDVLVKAIYTAAHDPGYEKFCTERNARWDYIPPDQVVPTFEKRTVVVREIMKKSGILKKK